MDTTTQSQSQKDVTFTQIVHGLQPYYPEKKLKDISVAFCFICLLHLANEEGLEIEMPNRDALNQSNASMIMSNNTMDNITDPDASVIGMDDLTIHL